MKHFTDLTHPYDRGPDALFNLTGIYGLIRGDPVTVWVELRKRW